MDLRGGVHVEDLRRRACRGECAALQDAVASKSTDPVTHASKSTDQARVAGPAADPMAPSPLSSPRTQAVGTWQYYSTMGQPSRILKARGCLLVRWEEQHGARSCSYGERHASAARVRRRSHGGRLRFSRQPLRLCCTHTSETFARPVPLEHTE